MARKRQGKAADDARPLPEGVKNRQKKSSVAGTAFTPLLSTGSSVFFAMIIAYFVPNLISRFSQPHLEWWQKTVIYQVYPRSFQDSNGDGVGDLQGIISRLDYIKSLGVNTVWLSPFYTSPMADFGYDVANYIDVDPIFGHMADFEQLVKVAHEKDMKVIVDFIPNHTSDRHKWFIESRKGGSKNPYRDFYMWEDGKTLENGTIVPPNNWLSIFGGSAWEWDERRNQYYLHQFVKEQPDLNYRNSKVRQKIKEVFKFWLDKGVDGFRIDAILTLFEDPALMDEPRSFKPGTKPNEHEYLDHPYTLHQDEIHQVTKEWRNFFDDYKEKTGKNTYFVVELYDETMDHALKYYHSGADAPFNFNLVYVNKTCYGKCIFTLIDNWLTKLPDGKWSHWVMGNHDQKRITSKKGREYANVMNMLLLLLPGTPTTYYGEEIGQLDIDVSFEDTQDPFARNYGKDKYKEVSRDPCRAPMQWNADENAGFSTAEKTWLPVHPDYETHNVKIQEEEELSHLNIYRKLVRLRDEPAFQYGQMDYVVINEDIFSFVRLARNQYTYMVALNVGNMPSTDNYEKKVHSSVKTEGVIVLNSGSVHSEALAIGKKIKLKEITLRPGEGIVMKITA